MPAVPQEYQHLLRGGRYRWWRPLLALLAAGGFILVAEIVITVVFIVAVAISGRDVMAWMTEMAQLSGPMDAITFSYVIASLVVLIPCVMLANWLVHGIRPRYLSSVVGGIRWRWLLNCLLITVPLWLLYLGIQMLLDWQLEPRPPQWIALLILVAIGIPFQSAAEEYAFRGMILQNVGAWIGNPKLALVIALIPSIALFAVAHGSMHLWVLLELGIFAAAATILTWRTGGLEAAIAVHATNNIITMFATILFGGWADAFVGGDTTGSPLAVAVSLVLHSVTVSLILWRARRMGIQRTTTPVPVPAPPNRSGQPVWGASG